MDYILIIAGIVLLVISGNWLVKAGSSLAAHFKIPPFIVGVTVISFGTSAPELFVSLSASINGFSDIAIGNVVGSNIANIGLVLAVSALIIAIPIQLSTIKLDFPVLIIASVLLIIFMQDGTIARWEGAIMLLVMATYLVVIIKSLRKNKNVNLTEEHENKTLHPALSGIIIILSCGGLVVASELLVKGAVNISHAFGVSERIISLTVIAIGTSLPELTTSVIAAVKKNLDIAVGNVIGSNIFNILVILGLNSVIKPMSVNPTILNFDIYFMLGFAVMLGLFYFPIRTHRISKWEGLYFLLAYIGYNIILLS